MYIYIYIYAQVNLARVWSQRLPEGVFATEAARLMN